MSFTGEKSPGLPVPSIFYLSKLLNFGRICIFLEGMKVALKGRNGMSPKQGPFQKDDSSSSSNDSFSGDIRLLSGYLYIYIS